MASMFKDAEETSSVGILAQACTERSADLELRELRYRVLIDQLKRWRLGRLRLERREREPINRELTDLNLGKPRKHSHLHENPGNFAQPAERAGADGIAIEKSRQRPEPALLGHDPPESDSKS
ncbi:uncharacterized protein Z519_05846 [Cladophialophora bantiana CBS 173.52]|uniref:Uncharacterized protein n=1 Tax=Cladophialophora bantiana (strain ATCC 10958 / CBS 173.52 / CDC B-1940 / NIH 8579) TaxID=1442370 RepID=A0A0D2ETI6_CLAB1|nr:uncharacterized protein Z519_05846 [Cladophialophora bantiana CBS 173.52]KIW93241.1 hypothetical protein Z519_05846 [Cladophialophora bantiana CBS 173.52]